MSDTIMNIEPHCSTIAPLVLNGSGAYTVTCQKVAGHGGLCSLVVEWCSDKVLLRAEGDDPRYH